MKRRWLFWLIILVATWMVLGRITEVRNLLETLRQGQWQWVLRAAGLTVLNQWLRAFSLQAAFSVVGVSSSIGEILPVWLASLFVNVAVPSGGASGGALFVDDASRRHQSPARAAAGMLLAQIVDYSAFAVTLVVGLVALYSRHRLLLYELLATGVFVAIYVGMLGILLTAIKQPALSGKLLEQVEKSGNHLSGWFRRGPLLKSGWAGEMAQGLIDAAQAIGSQPRALANPFLRALGVHLLNMLILGTLCAAFNQPFDLPVLLATYAMTLLFWIVSPTPQGIGVVEGVIALVLSSLGVPPEKATIIGLSFRGLTFWLPFGLGFLLLRRTRSFQVSGQNRALEVWADRIFVLLTGLVGLVRLSSTVTLTFPYQITQILQFLTSFFHFFSRLLQH